VFGRSIVCSTYHNLKGMTKERKVHAASISVVLLTLGIAVAVKNDWRLGRAAPRSPAAPQDTIYGMLDAARTGNVASYLDNYTGALQASLREAIRESTDKGFAKYLQESNAAVKGVAVSEPQRLGEGMVNVRVEYVYADRNEVQNLRLEKMNNEWKIAGINGAEQVKALVPYGTPVK
jgi:hypothetical protein